MKTTHKIIAGFVIILLLPIASAFLAAGSLRDISGVVSELAYEDSPQTQSLGNYQRGLYQIWIGTQMYSQGEKPLARQYMKNGEKLIAESQNALTGSEELGQFIDEVNKKKESVLEAKESILSAVDARDANKNEETERFVKLEFNFMQQRINALNVSLTALVDESQEHMTEEFGETVAMVNQTNSVVVTMSIISWVLLLIVALYIMISIIGPLNKIISVTNIVTDGDFDAKLPETNNKEIGALIGGIEMLIMTIKSLKTK